MKEFITNKVIFKCNLPPEMLEFGKLSEFLWSKKIKPSTKLNQELLSTIHGFSGIKHLLARKNFVELKKNYDLFLEQCKVERDEKTNSMSITFNPHTLIPILGSMDNFINELYGCLDFFSREIDAIFGFNRGVRSNFEDICNLLIKKYLQNNDKLAEVIKEFYESEGYKYLHGMRVRMIHRFPLVFQYSNTHLNLPDNPWEEKENPKIDNKIQIIQKSEEMLMYTLSFIDNICTLIGEKLFDEW